MSLRLSRFFKGGLAVAAVVWGGLGVPGAWAQQRLAGVEAQAARPPANVATNFVSAPVRPPLPKNGLLRLEEQLTHAFQFLKPSGSSLDGVPMPPMPVRPVVVVPSRRARELEEEKKNWMFLNPDDLTALPKAEDLLNVPTYGLTGQKDKSLTPVERFYQNMDPHSASKGRKRGPLDDAEELRRLHREMNTAQDADAIDPTAPASIREKESQLQKLLGLGGSSFSANPLRGAFSDVFGSDERLPTPSEELAQKEYLQGFSDWLNRSTAPTPTTASGLALPAGASDPTRPTASAYGSYSTFTPYNPSGRPDNYDPTIGTVNPTLAVTAPQDITTKVLNQWNPYYVPPKVDPPKTAPPAPVFDVPRRKF